MSHVSYVGKMYKFVMRISDISLARNCQCSHDKSRWNTEMGASVLKALVSPMFSLQDGDE
jgi:hypothetical protein